MEAKSAKIRDIISPGTRHRIPFFQRPYKWGKDEWERFFEDMVSTMTIQKNYFLGSIILKKEEDISESEEAEGIGSKYLVIDGQQRLTTLCIFMKILHYLSGPFNRNQFNVQYLQGEAKNTNLKHNTVDRIMFEKIMRDETLPMELDGNSQMAKAYNYFRNRFEEIDRINYEPLLNSIYRRIYFVLITLQETEDEQQIFDTINSLGRPLSIDELLKNFLYNKEEYEDVYRSNWQPLFDRDTDFWGTDAASDKSAKGDTMMDRFLHAFVRIKMWDYKDSTNGSRKLSEYERKAFVKKENIFSTCKSFVNDFGASRQELANEIIAYGRIFKDKFNDDSILEDKLPSHSCVERIIFLMKALKRYDMLPYVLYVLKNSVEEEQRQIFDYLERYVIRRMIAGFNDNSYSDLFSEQLIGAAHAITAELFKQHIKRREGVLAMPSNFDVENGILGKDAEKTSGVIYYMYETKRVENNMSGFNDYDTYPLMPKPSTRVNTADWPVLQRQEEEQHRKDQIKTIGNYFLLINENKRQLNKVNNKAFDEKKRCWLNCTSNITSSYQMIRTLTSWDVNNIENRNNSFARKWAEETWNI